MNVPFLDLRTQYKSIESEVLPGITDVMERAGFIMGSEVDQFEKEFAAFCGTEECIGVGSGCDALLYAMKGCGIGPGDEVIVPANTFIATVLAVTAAGAAPVLVDCLEDTYTIDPEAVAAAVTDKTKAIIPVHLYGQAADMDPLMKIAEKNGIIVIEDAAQAHGALYKGRPCGAIGKVGCFSFYPGKNLGAYGDGGAITTNNSDLAAGIRLLHNYGQSVKYVHVVAGWNSRLDSIQAVVLNAKLKRLKEWNELRHRNASAYGERLADTPLVLPAEHPDNYHIYHLYVVLTDRRDELMAFLGENGISCGMHYPIPVHMQEAYRDLGHKQGDFPLSEKFAGELLSLPMFPELTIDQIDFVSEKIHDFFAGG